MKINPWFLGSVVLLTAGCQQSVSKSNSSDIVQKEFVLPESEKVIEFPEATAKGFTSQEIDFNSPEAILKEMHRTMQAIFDDQTLVESRVKRVKDENGNIVEVKVDPSFGFTRFGLMNTVHDVPNLEKVAAQTPATKAMGELLDKIEAHGYVVDGLWLKYIDNYNHENMNSREFEYYEVLTANRVPDTFMRNVSNENYVSFGLVDANDISNSFHKNEKGGFADIGHGVTLYVAPILLSQLSCLTCHADSEVGDAKGYMAYLIRKP